MAMAAIIEEERKRRNVSQKEIAVMSGIAYGTYRNIIRSAVDVNIPDLAAIAAALSTTPLKGGGPEPVPVTPSELVALAVERAGGYEVLSAAVSEAPDP